jgi:hypothetical protein
VCCFLKTLARFQASLTMIAELDRIASGDDYYPLGSVPV